MKKVPDLDQLLALVSQKLATLGWGALAELARQLNTRPDTLQRWLKGEREPGGRVTLFLLAWVTASVRKPRSTPVAKPVHKPRKV